MIYSFLEGAGFFEIRKKKEIRYHEINLSGVFNTRGEIIKEISRGLPAEPYLGEGSLDALFSELTRGDIYPEDIDLVLLIHSCILNMSNEDIRAYLSTIYDATDYNNLMGLTNLPNMLVCFDSDFKNRYMSLKNLNYIRKNSIKQAVVSDLLLGRGKPKSNLNIFSLIDRV